MSNSRIVEALEARNKRKKTDEESRQSLKENSDSRLSAALSARRARIQSSLPSTFSEIETQLAEEVDHYNSTKPAYGAYDDTYASQRERRISISNLRNQVNAYRNYMNDDAADNISSMLDQMERGYDSYLDLSRVADDYYDSEISRISSEMEDLQAQREDYINNTPVDWTDHTSRQKYTQGLSDIEAAIEKAGTEKYQLEAGKQYQIMRFNPDYAELSKQKPTAEYVPNLSSNAALMHIQERNFYDNMTQDQIADYNYLYAKEGKEAADKYVAYISSDVNARIQAELSKTVSAIADKAPIISSLLSTPIKLMGGVGLVDVALQKLERELTGSYKPIDYNTPNMSFTNAGNAIRGTVSQKIADATGVIDFDEEKHPVLSRLLNGKSLADVYQLGMSMQDSAAIAGLAAINPVLGKVGTVLLSTSTGTDAMLNAVSKGASDEQALTMGILAAGFEMIFEKYELESLLGQGKNFWQALWRQGLSETVGEGATEASNILADVAVMAEKSDWKQNILRYLADNPDWDYSQAAKQAFIDAALQVGEASFGGWISGSTMGGGYSGIQNIVDNAQENRQAYDLYGESQQELVTEGLELNPDNAYAQKLQDRLNKGKNLSGAQLRKLAGQNESAIETYDVQTAAADRLTELGETEQVDTISRAIAKKNAGQTLTRAESESLRTSQYGERVLNELSEQLGYSPEWVSRIGQEQGNVEASAPGMTVQRSFNTPGIQPIKAEQGNVDTADITDTQNENAPEGRYEVSTDGQTIQNSTGEAVTIQEIASVKDGKMTFRTEAGTEVDAGDVSFGSRKEAQVYKAVARLGGIIDAETANKLSQHLLKLGKTDSDFYARSIIQAYQYGYYGYGRNSLLGKHTLSSLLTDEQRNVAYGYGKKLRESGSSTGVPTSKKTKRRKGKVMSWGMPLEQLKRSFSPTQKQAFDIISTIADVTGIDVVLYRSKADANGNLRGGIVNGINMDDSQGAFSWHDSKIYVDVNAGLTNKSQMNDFAMYSMLRTFSHEFVHFIEKHNPVEYENFRDLVFEVMREKGSDPEDLIDAYMMQHQNATHDEASREVVAEAMTDILPESQFVQRLAQKHQGLFKKLLERLKAFIKEIKDHFAHIGDTSAPEVAAVREQVDGAVRYAEKIVEAFDRVAVQAVERYQKGAPAQKNTTEGGVQMQIKEVGKTGKFYVQANRQVLTGDDPQAWKKQIEKYINEVIRKDEDVAIPTEDGHILLLTARSAYKLSDNHVASILKKVEAFLSDEDYARKGRVATHIDELIRVARFDEYGPDLDHKHENDIGEDGFNYFEAYFQDYDGKYYRVTFSSGINENMETVYSIGRIRQRRFPASRGSSPETGALNSGRKPSGDIIYTSSDKSQEAKSAIKLAYEKALAGKSQKSEQHQHRTTTLSNRMILEQASQAVDSQDLTPGQRSALKIFQEHLDELRKLEEKKAVQQKILNDARKKRIPKAEYWATVNRRNILSTQIERETTRLLELENTDVLRRVLEQAKNVIVEEQAAIREQALKDYRNSQKKRTDGRKRTEERNKIRRTIKELRRLLERGTKERNIKEGMQAFVEKALDAADILFKDDYLSDEDIIRRSISPHKPESAALFKSAQNILRQIDALQNGSDAGMLDEVDSLMVGDTAAYDQRMKQISRLQARLSPIKTRLKDWFAEERSKIYDTPVSEALDALGKAYRELGSADDMYIRAATDEVVCKHLESLSEQLEGRLVNDMSLKQLEMVHEAYKMVLNTVRTANKSFAAGKDTSISQRSLAVIQQIRAVGGSHKYLLGSGKANAFAWNNLKPIYAIEKLGSPALKEAFWSLIKAEGGYAKDINAAADFADQMRDKYGYEKWDMKKKYSFTSTSGIDFELTLEQIMSLYAFSRREQALDHLRIGGFVFDSSIETYKVTETVDPETGETKQKRSILKYRVNTADAHQLSQDILTDIISVLDPKQAEFVEKMQAYLSDTMGAKGNEVSMAMYGIKLFKEKHYWPLKSSNSYMFQQNETAGEVRIKNAGFTQKTKPKANNPIILQNLMDVWAGHVHDMSMYHSFTLPLEDFNRIFNFATPRKEGQDPAGVKMTIQNAYGKEAVDYVRQMIVDLNGGARNDTREGVSKALVSRFKKASVAASLSVAIQQPSALNRAKALVPDKYFLTLNPRLLSTGKLWEECKTYAPVAAIKEMGKFDMDTGMGTINYIKAEKKGFIDVVDDVTGWLPAKADEWTWVQIWAAVKKETAARNPELAVDSKEFLEAAGDRFTEVIVKTQVYDSTLSRSGFMRSKSGLVQMTTAFMAEPTTSINMIQEAMWQWKRGYRQASVKTCRAVLDSVIANAVLVSLVYALRDDDEDETFVEKYFGALTTEVIDGMNPLTYIPWVRDVWSIAQGFDVERTDMSLINDAADALTTFGKLCAKDTDSMNARELSEHKRKVVTAAFDIVDQVANCFGLPVRNVRREIMAFINTAKNTKNNKQYGIVTNHQSFWNEVEESVRDTVPVMGWTSESKSDQVYDALASRNIAQTNRLKSTYRDKDGNFNETAYHTAIRKGLRENDTRITKAAKARLNGDHTTANNLLNQIAAEGRFSRSDISAAIKAEYNHLKDD